MLEAVVLLFALLVGSLMGGVLGGAFAETRISSSNELSFVTTGAVLGTLLVALGIFMLPLP